MRDGGLAAIIPYQCAIHTEPPVVACPAPVAAIPQASLALYFSFRYPGDPRSIKISIPPHHKTNQPLELRTNEFAFSCIEPPKNTRATQVDIVIRYFASHLVAMSDEPGPGRAATHNPSGPPAQRAEARSGMASPRPRSYSNTSACSDMSATSDTSEDQFVFSPHKSPSHEPSSFFPSASSGFPSLSSSFNGSGQSFPGKHDALILSSSCSFALS